MTLLSQRVQRIGTENAFKIGPYINEVAATGVKVIRCNLGEPDFPLPAHIRDEVKRQLDADMTHYVDPQGMLPLREAVATEMGARRGLAITPDRVVVFPGGKPPIGFSQEVYCDPGDEVIYPSPGFPIYESFTNYLGLKPVPLHLDEAKGFAFSGEDLAPLITPRTKLIILNFPSNPTGGVASREQLESIASVILAKAPADVRIYADEIYENILFDGSRHFSIASLPGMAERTIIASGASKSYSWTGGRIGWAVLPTAAEAAVFKTLNINYFSCIAGYNQLGAKLAIESPESRPVIERMVRAFEERRDMVVNALNSIDGIRCQLPKGAFYVFPNIAGLCDRLDAPALYERLPADAKPKTSPATLVQMFLLFRYGVATLDRRAFGVIGAEGRHFLRISVATALDDLKEGMERIRTAAADRAGFAAFVREGRRLS
jgi:aspartate/methionine/tyrosine aminotransferase